MRPSRYLFTLAAIFVIVYALVIVGGHGTMRQKFSPKLAIDLAGGTSMILQAKTTDGNAPSSDRLEQARNIIEQRVNNLGVSEAEVYTEGNDKIVVTTPGQSSDLIRQVGTAAQMRFRKVLAQIQDTGSPTATPTSSPTASASPQAAASASPGASASPAPAAATPTPAATPAPASTPEPTLDQVKAKLGNAYTVADNVDLSSVASSGTAASDASLAAFDNLTPAEIAVLPYNIQYVVPQITCEKLNLRPVGSLDNPDQRVVACGSPAGDKQLLDVAKVLGTDLSSAQANLDTTQGWLVDLTFTGSGSDKWNALTKEAFNNSGDAWGSGAGTAGVPANPNCVATASNNSGSGTVCMVAVVLDNDVITAPAIQAVLSTQSQITGSFTKDEAQLLANNLKYGALPVSFEIAALNTVTATLGPDYLRAGLLAMGIGMILVVIYAFFYYRLLGLVIVLSLVLSAALTFGMLVLLGRGIGFALSLAGIAGFIVSLGVAADSFVIYFERLKDEIREGRHPKAAVGRAWLRARRTIITANMVTFMAAVVLYLAGSSQVQGFAFALGLATLLDLVIVFLFRHPMMTLLARTPAFLSPRVSGLGRVLHRNTQEA
jgi:preprotein translocase subunit SecD